jgi:hypothetical protein
MILREINMSKNDNFSKALEKKLVEAFEYAKPANEELPLQIASFNVFDSAINDQPEASQNLAKVDPVSPVVTSGETAELGAVRQDKASEESMKASSIDPQALSEISSLLASIGYILNKEGIVSSKFDTNAVCEFLNSNFMAVGEPKLDDTVPCPPDDGTTPAPLDADSTGISQNTLNNYAALEKQPLGFKMMQEMRQFDENRKLNG